MDKKQLSERGICTKFMSGKPVGPGKANVLPDRYGQRDRTRLSRHLTRAIFVRCSLDVVREADAEARPAILRPMRVAQPAACAVRAE